MFSGKEIISYVSTAIKKLLLELFQEHPKYCNALKYKCDKCAYKFSNQRRLTKHTEKEHNTTAPK
jgi:hypothetical protein